VAETAGGAEFDETCPDCIAASGGAPAALTGAPHEPQNFAPVSVAPHFPQKDAMLSLAQ